MNRKARRCCGIDVHKASLSACIRLHGKGRKVSEEIRHLRHYRRRAAGAARLAQGAMG